MKHFIVIIFIFMYSAIAFGQNNAPIGNPDVDTADINTTLTVAANLGLLVNDTDVEGDTLSITLFFVNGIQFTAGQTANIAQGAITINADGSYMFIPAVGYTGLVPDIFYIVFDGTDTNTGVFQLTVEVPLTTDLLSDLSISSCNQGYTADGLYMIRYNVSFRNGSIAKDDHINSLITNVQITNNLNSVFGNGCITLIERGGLGASTSVNGVSTTNPPNFGGDVYPADFNFLDWDTDEFSEADATPGAENILLSSSNTHILYPRQYVSYNYCIYIDPTCAGTPINFDNSITVTSSRGSLTQNLEITDFHTSDTTVAANLYVQDDNPSTGSDAPNDNVMEPNVEPNATYNYINSVVITNDGTNVANDVNFNLGLWNFLTNGISFQSITISQSSGPAMNINNLYDGNTNSLLLLSGNSLNPGETVVLDIGFVVNPTASSDNIYYYSQISQSMTQGPADGFDESLPQNSRRYSFVVWSDAQGNHLDRYYRTDDITEVPTSNRQCSCRTYGMRYVFDFNLQLDKSISQVINPVNNVLEHHATTFVLRATNISSFIQIENVQIIDDLQAICGGNIISVSTPTILNSTATINPNLDTAFDGNINTSIFDGISGILEPTQFVEIEFTVVFDEDCIGTNLADFTAKDPLSNPNPTPTQGSVAVNLFTDTDGDGITNVNDLDDDNDTIPDAVENNGLDPTLDTDGDNIPDYLDTNAPTFVDSDGNGINDNYDFDGDGILNHLDLDTDNDGVFDIVESSNGGLDTNNNGRTNSTVGANGLEDTVELDDSFTATIIYVLPNDDTDSLPNYTDIDADNDGIVDNIEAQTTNVYQAPSNVVDVNGIDTNYINGINPTDTDGDNTPDFRDSNSDDDFYDDRIEGWDLNNDNIADTIFANPDSDNDGLVNNYDNDDNAVNPTNGQLPNDFPNLDVTTTTELDWREILIITVSITNDSEQEGNTLSFTVSMDNLSTTDVIIDVITQDITPAGVDFAVSPDDYTSQTTTLTIPSGLLIATTTFDVPSIDDTIYELDETFSINGTITTANTDNTTITGIGTIVNNDPPPTITVYDTSADEGDDLEFLIELSNPSSVPITIEFTTMDITAITGTDYQGGTVTVTIPALSITEMVTVQTIEDDIYEATETMRLTGIVIDGTTSNNNFINTGTIFDDEPLPTVSIDSPEVVEGNILVFTISLSNLSYETINLNVFTNNVTAQQPIDYTALTTQVSFPPFTDTLTIEVETIDDTLNEDTEFLSLTAVVTTFNTDNIQAINEGAILDNDIPNLFSPNDDGISDVFAIAGLQDFPEFTLQIFDRWGSEVHNYSNNGNLSPIWWNGTYKGNLVPEGVYYYILEFNDGITKPQSSFVELIR